MKSYLTLQITFNLRKNLNLTFNIMKKQFYNLKVDRLFISVLLIFLCVSITQAQDLPAHWDNDDVGDVMTEGTATFAEDVFTMNGSGADIYGIVDAFHYAYQPSMGDCEISAYIASVGATVPNAKACVMIRETLDAGSKFAMAVACPGPGVGTYFQRRLDTDAECSNDNLNHGQPAPVWVKLVRIWNTFTASYSVDGETWLPEGGISIEIVMEEDAYIGLGVSAHNNDGSLCETTFENVVVDPGIDYPSAINELNADELSVYPNPVADILTVEICEKNFNKNSIIYIHNNLGQLIREEKVASKMHLLDLSNIPQGLYFITLKNDQDSIVKKISKK